MNTKSPKRQTGPAASQLPAGQERADYVKPPAEASDPIDEAAEESFPASDPPAFTGAAATPSDKAASPEHRRTSKSCKSSSCEKE
jgi:hypothetical protein